MVSSLTSGHSSSQGRKDSVVEAGVEEVQAVVECSRWEKIYLDKILTKRVKAVMNTGKVKVNGEAEAGQVFATE